MEKLVSSVPYFYGASEKSSNNVRLMIDMKDEVDKTALEYAVEQSMKRYPYFCAKVVQKGEELYLEKNDAAVPVVHTKEPVTLGGTEAQGHLIAFSCWGKQICMDAFHGLADGVGLMPFVRTVIYYYCCERYQRKLDPEGTRIVGEEIPQEEILDPYPESVDENIKPMGRYVRKPAFSLRTAGLCNPGKPTWYEILIPEKEFMEFNKKNGGSPAVTVAVLMARAVSDLHPQTDQPIVCSMAMNIRKTLQAPKAHHSLVTQLFLEYKDAMKSMSISDQITCFRGMIILQGQDENVWQAVRGNLKINAKLDALPTLESKRMMMDQIVGSCLGLDTFKVSYAGKNDLGEAEEYVENIHSVLDISNNSMLIEMNAVNGYFQLTVMQDWEETVYLDALCNQLNKQGVSYQVSVGHPVQVAATDFSEIEKVNTL